MEQTKQAPPGRSSLTTVFELRKDQLGFLLETWRHYGDVARIKIGPVDNYLVVDPEAVQRVLQDNNRNYDKRTLDNRKMRLALGEGLVTSDGDFWRRQRRI